MLRSMYSGIAGMKGFQTKLDVIGNNIANVNTSGFKKGRVTFQDMMSQTTRGAQAATGERGGINPMQVGLGSQTGSIDNIHTQGFRQSTGNPLDFAIEGNGMFVVTQGTSTYYTRAGNFYLDDAGAIVNPDGMYLKGFALNQTNVIEHEGLEITLDDAGNPIGATFAGEEVTTFDPGANGEFTITYPGADGTTQTTVLERAALVDENGDEIKGDNGDSVYEGAYSIGGETVNPKTKTESTNAVINLTIPADAQSFSVSDNGTVNYIDSNGQPRVAGRIALANFSNPAGLEKIGSNLFFNTPNAGYTGVEEPDQSGMGKVVASALEMSNVDLAEEFTEMIVAQRAFQSNTRIITTSDEILQELVNLKR